MAGRGALAKHNHTNMNIKLNSDFSFSDEHAAGSYGQPVLVFQGVAFGPADELPENDTFSHGTTGADALRYFYECGDDDLRTVKADCHNFMRLGGLRV